MVGDPCVLHAARSGAGMKLHEFEGLRPARDYLPRARAAHAIRCMLAKRPVHHHGQRAECDDGRHVTVRGLRAQEVSRARPAVTAGDVPTFHGKVCPRGIKAGA